MAESQPERRRDIVQAPQVGCRAQLLERPPSRIELQGRAVLIRDLHRRAQVTGQRPGGVGVVAIMMISVTERTREIGVRKALGATRKEILWQFLVEAATLTGFGGLLGVMFGLLGGQLLKFALGLDSGVPVWSAVTAVTASVMIGLVFGMIPASRAARMDPVEALRHE